MSKVVALSLLLALLCSCSTTAGKKFLRFENGPILERRKNFKTVDQGVKYKATFEKQTDKKNIVLLLKITKNTVTEESWDEVYSKMAVYGSGYQDGKNVSVTEDGTLSEPKSRVVTKSQEIDAKSVNLTINNKTASAQLEGGVAQFKFASLKLNPDEMPIKVEASVDIGDTHIEASNEFAKFIAAVAQEESQPETKYKMPFCRDPSLYSAVFFSLSPVQEKCIYRIGVGAMLKVMQVTDDGILVVAADSYALAKIIFIKTKKQYVDGDFIQNIFISSIGPVKYTNTLGAGKTVNAFQYLGEVIPR